MKTSLLFLFIIYVHLIHAQCAGNDPAGNSCATATPICELNGYCGNTSASYTANSWNSSCGFLGLLNCGLTGEFCGSIENNSFLSFTASATTLSFDVLVTSSTLGYGIQIFIFSATNCSGDVIQYGPCYNPGNVASGPVNITASGLTIGNTYYIMIDGNAGDVVSYEITANSGVAIPVDVTPASTTICSGESVNLSATGGNGVYNWNANPNLSATTGANVTATPPGPGTYNYTVNSSGGNPLCPSATSSTATVIVNPCGCTTTANNSGPICSGGTVNLTSTAIVGATYSWSGPGGFTSSVQNPTNVSPPTAPGTYDYTVTATVAGVPCTSTTTVTVNAAATVDASVDQSICAGGTINLAGIIGGGATSATWSAPSGTFSNSSNLNSTYTPSINSGSVTLTLTSNASGTCPSVSDNLVVTIVPNATANANVDQSVCAGGTVNLNGIVGGGVSTGTWSAPSGSFSNATSLTSTYTPSITSGTVTLTLTSGVVGSCPAATDQMILSVNPMPTANANSDQSVCAGGTINLSGSIGGGATSGTWSASSGSFSDVNTLNSTYTPSIVAGNITLTLTSNTSSSCPVATDQMIVTIVSNATANANVDQSVCAGGTINLNGIVGGGASTGSWSAPSGSFSNVNSLTSNYTPSITNGTVTLTLTSGAVGSCPAATDQMVVTVNPLPTANANSDQSVCAGGTVNLSGVIGGGANGGTWSATSGSFSDVSNLNSTYSPSITSGTVILTLTSSSSNSCPEASDQIIITIIPNATANANVNQTVCEGETIDLNGSVGGGVSTGIWSAPSGSFSDATSLSSSYTPSITNGTVVLTLTSENIGSCPEAIDEMVVTVNPLPLVDAGNDQTVCEGDMVVFNATGASNLVWDNSVVNGVGFVPLNSGTYTVVGMSNGCFGSDQLELTISPNPEVSFSADIISGCVPVTITFSNTSLNSNSCFWEITNGSNSNECGVFSHTFTEEGCYDVTLTSTSTEGCVSSLTQNAIVCLSNPPVASFDSDPSTVNELNSEVQFTNTSSGSTSYSWDFGDDSPSNSMIHPSHNYQGADPGNYVVTLIAYNASGCSDTTSQIIQNEELLIYYVPNTFTPDGDNFNQTFKPVFTSGFETSDYSLIIFNRWGEMIFESHNVEIGWDGYYGSEKSINICQEGTYVYRIEFKTSSSDAHNVIHGHVNLIK